MATSMSAPSVDARGERSFFFIMAIAIAATAVIGFSFAWFMGNSSFGAPWWVHVHAVTMMGWMGLYLTQNALVWRGNVAAHRQLGVVVAAWSVWMLPVALAITAMSLNAKRIPPFFDSAFFLVMDWLNILLSVALIWTGVRMRDRPDWHKRLMLGGTITVLGPAWGRLLPLPYFGNNIIWPISAILLLYFAVAMVYDLRTRGKVHPAYYWGAGGLSLFALVVTPIASLPPVIALSHAIAG